MNESRVSRDWSKIRLNISYVLLGAALLGFFIDNIYYTWTIVFLFTINLLFQFKWYRKESKKIDYRMKLLDLEMQESLKNLNDLLLDFQELNEEHD